MGLATLIIMLQELGFMGGTNGWLLTWLPRAWFCESWPHCVPRAVGQGIRRWPSQETLSHRHTQNLSPGERPRLQTGSDVNQVTHVACDWTTKMTHSRIHRLGSDSKWHHRKNRLLSKLFGWIDSLLWIVVVTLYVFNEPLLLKASNGPLDPTGSYW